MDFIDIYFLRLTHWKQRLIFSSVIVSIYEPLENCQFPSTKASKFKSHQHSKYFAFIKDNFSPTLVKQTDIHT
jgi:hypothetical protein